MTGESLAERFGSVDTLRVEKLREILADHHRQREAIQANYADLLALAESDPERHAETLQRREQRQANLRMVTVNRFADVLSESWEPGVVASGRGLLGPDWLGGADPVDAVRAQRDGDEP